MQEKRGSPLGHGLEDGEGSDGDSGEMGNLNHLSDSCCWFTPCAHREVPALRVRGAGAGSVPPLGLPGGLRCTPAARSGAAHSWRRGVALQKQAGVGSAMVTPWEGVLCLPFALQMCPAVGDFYRWEQGSMAWQAESSSLPQGEGAALADLQHLVLLSHSKLFLET